MANIAGPIGGFLGALGDIDPDTIKLLHEREKMGVEERSRAAEEAFRRSELGLTSQRLQQAITAANERAAQWGQTFAQRGQLAEAALQQRRELAEAARKEKQEELTERLTHEAARDELRAMEREQARREGQEFRREMRETATGSPTPYKTFYNSQKAKGKTDEQIIEAWNKMQMGAVAERLNIRAGAPGGVIEKRDQLIGQIEETTNIMEELIPRLFSKGILSKGTSIVAQAPAEFQWHIAKRNDPDLAEWKRLAANMVGYARSVSGDIGMRAQVGYLPDMVIFMSPTSVGAARAVLGQVRRFVNKAKEYQKRTIPSPVISPTHRTPSPQEDEWDRIGD